LHKSHTESLDTEVLGGMHQRLARIETGMAAGTAVCRLDKLPHDWRSIQSHERKVLFGV
jgi:hypothetical protein